ncbi:phosphopyruvate hydratase [Herbiconiux solani]|uniref:phosphopyruvate hydratase n=1 Tax=Herbiconiux solani TaxID=661329 RepID=UPI0008255FC2|nr:phosphopyruvate hydratase [Herbiconiux solani]
MTDTTITALHAWEALDSRGRPTVACTITLAGGAVGRAIVPSGASTGAFEAKELRDGGPEYAGFGVRRAVESANTAVAAAVVGLDAVDQVAVDAAMEALDPDPELSAVGSNGVLAASLATLLAAAASTRTELWRHLDPDGVPLIPLPMVNIVSGGAHAGKAIDIQDILVIPVGSHSFREGIEWVDRVRRATAELLEQLGGWSALVADEGGLSARLADNESALDLVTRGIEAAGFTPRDDVSIAIDVAASQLVDAGGIRLRTEDRVLPTTEWVDRLAQWVSRFPIVSIEDPLGESDWEGWAEAAATLTGLQLLGDDLFATNDARLARGIRAGVANSVLVKPNQGGTVTRARRVVESAQAAGFAPVVSARSGDTEDHWLADLAVGWRAGQIKVGSTMRSERTAKWNRLLEIESATETVYAGSAALAR